MAAGARRPRPQADVPDAGQSLSRPPSSTDVDVDVDAPPPLPYLAALSFPTLSRDGSVVDARSVPVPRRRHHHHHRSHLPPTPPAALSSLGATAKMAAAHPADHLSESTSSLADSQYDMIDDLSEASNDDHETASLASTERHPSERGAITPDDAGSIAGELPEELSAHEDDDDEEDDHDAGFRAHLDALDPTTRVPVVAHERRGRDEEDGVVESYLSDNLETPRQSTLRMPTGGSAARDRPPPYAAAAAHPSPRIKQAAGRPFRVLFIADRSIPNGQMDVVCSKIASCLAVSETTSGGRVLKLPPTSTGVPSLPSAALFRCGDVQVTVQHCIGADSMPGRRAWDLRILDAADGFHSTVCTVGFDSPAGWETPDLSVVYHTSPRDRGSWLQTADDAMRRLGIPVLTLIGGAASSDTDTANGAAVFDSDVFLGMRHENARIRLDDVLGPRPSDARRLGTTGAAFEKEGRWTSWQEAVQRPGGVSALLPKLIAAVLALVLLTPYGVGIFQDPIADTALRRQALSSALVQVTHSSDIAKLFNVEHLLPEPSTITTNAFGQAVYSAQDHVHYQGAYPNHIVVSLPRRSGYWRYPAPQAVRVARGGKQLAFNQTKLVDGIYHLALHPSDAYGTVVVDIVTKRPTTSLTLTYNFGHPMLQRHTYEKATAELTRTMNRDLADARKVAKSLGEMLHLELAAGAAATRNITSQLAVQVTRDVHVFARTAALMLGKAGSAGNQTAAALRKDLHLIQQHLDGVAQSLEESLVHVGHRARALIPSKKTAVAPIRLGREHALRLQEKLFGGKKDTDGPSASTELSTYVQKLFHPSSTTRQKLSKWQDIARCLRAQDFATCREAQRTGEDSTGSSSVAGKVSNSLATVPGWGVAPPPPPQHPIAEKRASARDGTRRRETKCKHCALRHLAKEQAAVPIQGVGREKTE